MPEKYVNIVLCQHEYDLLREALIEAHAAAMAKNTPEGLKESNDYLQLHREIILSTTSFNN